MTIARALRVAVALGITGFAGVLVRYASRPPPPVVPLSAPLTVFSAERAMQHVRQIARLPHPPGSVEHARVRAYLADVLTDLGLDPQIQQTTALSRGGGVAGRIQNIVARLPGSDPGGRAVLLAAHYDGVGAGPAASDDAAGVAVLLETLRALRAGPALTHDVIFLISDGEEVGLLGAGAFVRDHAWAADVDFILNFEARGTRGRSIMFESTPGNLDAIRLLRGFGDAEANSLWTPIYRSLPNDTDLSRLAVLGRPALNFAYVDGVERYHTSQDDTLHLDLRSLQHHGDQALYLASRLAAGPLPRPATGDAIFFAVPGMGMVVHPQRWNVVFVGLLILIVAAAGAAVRGAGGRWMRDTLAGVSGGVATIGLGGIGAGVLVYVAPAGVAAVGWRMAYTIAIALAAVMAAAIVRIIVRTRERGEGVHLGAILLWSAVAVLMVAVAPGASYLFLWPSIAMAAALGVRLTWPGSAIQFVVSTAGVITVMMLVIPPVYLVGVVGLGVLEPGGIVIGLATSLVAWLLLPQLDFVAGSRRRFLPGLTLGGALAILAACALIPRPPDAVPEKSALLYALDADRGLAWLATPRFLGRPGSWGGEAIRSAADDDVIGVSSPSNEPNWIRRGFVYPYPPELAEVSPLPLAGATVELLADSTDTGDRVLTLNVSAPAGTLEIAMRLSGAPVRRVDVDGHRLPFLDPARPDTIWSMAFAAPPQEGVRLRIRLGDGSPNLELITRSAGLPEAILDRVVPRPVGVIPGFSGDMTAVRRDFAL